MVRLQTDVGFKLRKAVGMRDHRIDMEELARRDDLDGVPTVYHSSIASTA